MCLGCCGERIGRLCHKAHVFEVLRSLQQSGVFCDAACVLNYDPQLLIGPIFSLQQLLPHFLLRGVVGEGEPPGQSRVFFEEVEVLESILVDGDVRNDEVEVGQVDLDLADPLACLGLGGEHAAHPVVLRLDLLGAVLKN